MQLSLLKWEYEDQLSEIRTIQKDGEFWFAATDVATTLGYKGSVSETINRHCKPKGVMKHDTLTKGGMQSLTYINEANVYRLVVKSTLPSAERFEEWLMEDVLPSIRKNGFYGKINRAVQPNSLTRYIANFHKVDNDYFCVITEMINRLYVELEKSGYAIPDKGIDGQQMMPDISIGLTFSAYLKKTKSIHLNTHKFYKHTFPDGREVDARQYPIDAWPDFVRFINDVWIPKYAAPYFKKRDPLALDFLPKLLGRGKAA